MKDWQTMTPATLDAAYANADHIPGADAYPPRWQADAAAFRAALGHRAEAHDHFDLFLPDAPPQGLTIFIHGGYWRRFGKSDWSHFSEGPLAHGQAVAMVGYPLAPTARIAAITAHVARTVDTIAARIPGPIRLTGHSAGGHLAARMVMPDAAPACAARIATCVPISPVADLRPLVPQSMNADLRLDSDEAGSESPALHRPLTGPRIAIHVGADERPSFLWQAETLASAWGAPLRIAPGKHHFDVIDALRDPASPLVADLLA